MTKRLNFRTENVDFQIYNSAVPKTDSALYKALYKFDTNAELKEYNLPLESLNQEEVKLKSKKTLVAENKSEIEEEQDYVNEEGENVVSYNQIIRSLFDEKKQKPVGSHIQNALFIDAEVRKRMHKIHTGEDAISFFAKYGNSTPIKFIYCILDETNTQASYRPYDLKVVQTGEKHKELNFPDYYTISASGIVHIYNERYLKTHGMANSGKNTTVDRSTEVTSLSDWMHESTIDFCKTRRNLVLDGFYGKPIFSINIVEVNKILYEIQLIRTVSNSILTQNTPWEVDNFKGEQKKARNDATKHWEMYFERLVTLIEDVCKTVNERTIFREDNQDDDNALRKNAKQKPMNEERREKEERIYRLELAKRDQSKLIRFIRQIDYMEVENLISSSQLSMKMLLEEMMKDGRETRRTGGLFNSSVMFEESGISFSPNSKDIEDTLMGSLDEMIKVAKETSRIIEHKSFEPILKNVLYEIPDIEAIIVESKDFIRIRELMLKKIYEDFEEAQKYVDLQYEKCRIIYQDTKNWRSIDYEKEPHTLEDIKILIVKLNQWILDINQYINDTKKGIVNVDSRKIKGKLQQHVESRLQFMKEFLYQIMKKKADNVFQTLQSYCESLSKSPNSLPDYAKFIESLNESKNHFVELDLSKAEIESMHTQLKKFDAHPIKPMDTVQLEDIVLEVNKLSERIREGDEIKNEKRTSMIEKLDKARLDLKDDIEKTNVTVNAGKMRLEDIPEADLIEIGDALGDLTAVKATLNEIKKATDKYKSRDKDYTTYQALMDLSVQPIEGLNSLESKYNDRKLIWNSAEKMARCKNDWFKSNFLSLDNEEIEKDMKNFELSSVQLRQRVNNLSETGKDVLLDLFAAESKKLSSMLPIFQSLGNKDLRPRHWKRIFEILNPSWQPGNKFNLTELLANGALEKKDVIEEISGRASGEAQIETNLEIIKTKWSTLAFFVNPYRDYKDKFTIGQIDDIIAMLDEHQGSIQTMLGTRFVAEIRPVVEEWEKKLVLISDIIDEWLACQRQWMYLENIFSAEDIQKQLPQETARFNLVDKFWKEIMQKTNKRPIVQDCCNSEELLKKFQMNNGILDEIQKSLENYLETKRLGFPRFYFLSNDELLEILSQTKNPHAVQAHLRKCFDNINRIKFSEERDSRTILAMISAEPETMPEVVKFSKPVVILPEDRVEQWLTKIEREMINTLFNYTKKALVEYPKNGLERKEWLFNYPSQAVLTVDLIKWTENVEAAILGIQRGNKNAMKEFLEFSRIQINRMVDIVRDNLNILERTLMGALIVLDVHAKDVVDKFVEMSLNGLNDFEWNKQLRYYWEKSLDNCIVRQTNTRFEYAYEYLGNGPRLVITPLTDKCYMTLTGALHLNFGGAPQGPAGTGKTETTKDLAKALAIPCVVFNCSDSLEFKTMGRFFSGLAQAGAWSCFDEFNRIYIEVLSVIAQQIMTIQFAVRAKLTQFEFEGRVIPLNWRFGVFITMNPGYAGRTELPDNLKSLFRPISMMIPDYALIAEIILFSEGFQTARELANKMVQLYKLSSEQLTKQSHYDFGMRAVKSVLVMAGSLRRADPDTTEQVVLIRAMRDSNVPKFLADDLVLFMGIIQDLFPKVEIPKIISQELEDAVVKYLESENLQKPESFMIKIMQLMETIKVRHGVMIVGATGTGKTKCYETLSNALANLHKEGFENYWYKPITSFLLNPKSVSMNELFGFVNVMTNEWNDGIVAKIVRDAVAEVSDTKKWVIFDGPVDALWIENMNTVLDDNKMLCLSNGQRIKLPATFTMLFEVNDLAVASPATVSRCGMVYMEAENLGWEPILDTWAITFKEKENNAPSVIQIIEKIRTFFKEILPIVRKECKEVVATVDVNLVQSCLNMINSLLTKMRIALPNSDKLTPQELEQLSTMIFIFSFIWSCGGNMYDNPKNNSRAKFSQIIKSRILKIFSNFPFEGEVYDFYIDFEKREFRPWTELVTEFKYRRDKPFFALLVPTTDTVKFRYLLDSGVSNSNNVLVMGETGVGKSVIIQDFAHSLKKEDFVFAPLNFSAQTTSKNVVDVLMDKLVKKKRDLYGPPSGKKMVLFIDDINMPQPEKYMAQPPIELLRQIIDHGGFYEMKKLMFTHIVECVFISACAPPGGGRNAVTPRLFRHFHLLWNPDLSIRSMETIFGSIMKGFLLESPVKGLDRYSMIFVRASIDIYLKVTRDLLPTPSKSHYTFNLRDLSKIFQGILQIHYNSLPNKEMLTSLWVHETSRVFYDRLVDDKDKDWFFKVISDQLTNHLSEEWEREDFDSLLFGDYASNSNEYSKVEKGADVSPKFQDALNLFNLNFPKTMNLVFFKDAISHLSRISRILKQERGNALLIGVGGSGRGSLTKLAAFMRGYSIFSIEIAKNYKEPQWKDDLKRLLKLSGSKDKHCCFLFSDTQIVQESFLEDLNNILNTGEVPNLWATEDIDEILGDVRPLAKSAGVEDSKDSLLKYFVQMVRDRLHIVLAFSPVGEKLRTRCRQFPSIINCCTIDWFNKWPDEALYSVAQKEYKNNEHFGIGEYIEKLSGLSVEMHSNVVDTSETFYEELRRRNYTTPTSYLELIRLYIEQLKFQLNILPLKIRKYTVGLQTLKETNGEVSKLQKRIIEFQPILEESAKENAKLLIELEAKSKVASETEAICSKEAAIAQEQRDGVNLIRNDCKRDLDEALPILERAIEEVGKIDKQQIFELKGYPKPPDVVMLLTNALCLLFGEKEDWENAKKILGRMNFLNDLKTFNVDEVAERKFIKLRETYLKNPKFTKEEVSRVSTAAGTILNWITAIDDFQKVKKVVGPKEKSLKEAEEKLKAVEEVLDVRMNALREVQENVSELKRNYDNSLRKAESLRQQQENAKVQLSRAEKLVSLLGGEAQRWKDNADELNLNLKNLTGNIILSAAFISYLGPFNSVYRQTLIKKWEEKCKELEIPTTPGFSLEKILAEEVQVREWQDCGLPADRLSTENGILMFNCRRWPLIIDPQNQANKWIKNLQKDNNLQVTKLTESNYLKTLENCIRFGSPCLMENVEEELDPSLEPILLKQIVKKGAQYILKLGDSDIPYSNDFRFYITSKLPNPHYLPELSIKVTIINFTVTPKGLEDQLLIEVVRYEKIELEETRISLILQISQDRRQLLDLEDKILRQISEVQGRILEDEGLITTLETSKTTSDTVNQRMKQAKLTQDKIELARESYRKVATRGSVIYFVIADLALIDPMYQYSLEFFIKLFKKRLDLSEKSEDPEARLEILINDITKAFYSNICRGLFEKDKLLFSFLISIKILINKNIIQSKEWDFFLRANLKESTENKPSFISEKMWATLNGLSDNGSAYYSLFDSMKDSEKSHRWLEIVESPDPWKEDFSSFYEKPLTPFQKLLFLKVLREEKLIINISNFVTESMGRFFIVPPVFDLKSSFDDTTSTTPIVFVLSPGANPINYLRDLATEKEMNGRFRMLSLGQGQGDTAAEWIRAGRRNGDWVCLQNCHLAVSWLGHLERIQDSQEESETHPDYRLWLTSMPTPLFPVSVLQSGVKLTNEPPKGIRANLRRTYNEIKEVDYESCPKPNEYKRLLFSLALFHAIILERRKFGAIGWNIPYEWMNSDFETSQLQLKMYISEQPEVPYVALNVLVAEINYGGRVTDDKDMILIKAILKKYFTPKALDIDYKFSTMTEYDSPKNFELEAIRHYINELPLDDLPELFGLHSNASITLQQKVVREFMDTLLDVSPRTAGGKASGLSPDYIVSTLAANLEKKIPGEIEYTRSVDPKSLEIFRNQEIDRFNILIRKVKQSLNQLQNAIKGTVVMSMELEKMYTNFLNKKVPEIWTKVAYLSLKPLSSFVEDFIERVEFFNEWVNKGLLQSYWISAFYFPQGFMTATLQTYARKHIIPIDTLRFKTVILQVNKDDLQEVPEEGVNIHGLFIQGAKWNIEKMILQESDPAILFQSMPVIKLEPIQNKDYKPVSIYKCPLYKTTQRAGELSTTGHSTNFVLYLDLQTEIDFEEWTRGGVALICQLDD